MIMEQRKILFKAKRLDNSEWVKGDLVHAPLGTRIEWWENNALHVEDVDPSTVCQFTGILDKDSKEIFENDLIQITQTKEVYVLTWNPIYCYYSFLDKEGNFYVGESFAEHHSRDMLIIGNRFDRKEEK